MKYIQKYEDYHPGLTDFAYNQLKKDRGIEEPTVDVHDKFHETMMKLEEEQGRFTKIDDFTTEFVLQEFMDESGLSLSELEKYADFDDDHIMITIDDDENTLTYTNDF